MVDNIITCAICLDDIDTTNDETTIGTGDACCHVFHRCCMKEWLVRKPTCPTCRVQVMNHVYSDLQIDYPVSENNIIAASTSYIDTPNAIMHHVDIMDSALNEFLDNLPRLNIPSAPSTPTSMSITRGISVHQ